MIDLTLTDLGLLLLRVTAVLAAAWGVCFAWPRASAAVRHAGLLAGCAGRWRSRWRWWLRPRCGGSRLRRSQRRPDRCRRGGTRGIGHRQRGRGGSRDFQRCAGRAAAASPPAPPPTSPALPWPTLLLIVWGCGSVAASLPLALGCLRAMGWRRRCPQASSGAVQEASVRAAARVGLRRLPAVRLAGAAEAPGAPLVFGIFRPVVLLPEDADAWPRDRLASVLMHEMAHLVRRDLLALRLRRRSASRIGSTRWPGRASGRWSRCGRQLATTAC